MKFSDTSSKSGIIQDCETLLAMDDGDISGNTTLLKTFTRLINARNRQVASLIWRVQADWQYDDDNQTTLPIATTDLVADQQDYALPSTGQKVERVEVLDANGDYQLITPLDWAQVGSEAMTEFEETSGMPVYYDLVGRSIMLYPKPGTGYVTTTAGLKVYFARDIVEFNSTATTQEPGFSENFHRMLSLGSCIDYGLPRGLPVGNYQALLSEMKQGLEEFYTKRHKDPDSKARINPNMENYL